MGLSKVGLHPIVMSKQLLNCYFKGDIINAVEYANHSVPIIRKASDRETRKSEADLIKSKPWDSIGKTITLTRQSFPDGVSHQSKYKRPNGNMKHTSTTQ